MVAQQTELPKTFLAANRGHVRGQILPSASSAEQKTNCHEMPVHYRSLHQLSLPTKRRVMERKYLLQNR